MVFLCTLTCERISPKHIALKADVLKDWKVQYIIYPRNVTGCGSDGVKALSNSHKRAVKALLTAFKAQF